MNQQDLYVNKFETAFGCICKQHHQLPVSTCPKLSSESPPTQTCSSFCFFFFFLSVNGIFIHPGTQARNLDGEWCQSFTLLFSHSRLQSITQSYNFSYLPTSLLLSIFPWSRPPSALAWVITRVLNCLPDIHPTTPQYS